MNIKEMLEKKINEKQKKHRAEIIKKVTVGAAAGIAAGIVGGVLIAPKAGKETRDDIAKTAKDFGENAVTKTAELKETLDNKVVETKINATVAKEKIAKYLADKKAEKKAEKKAGKNSIKDEAIIEEIEEAYIIANTEE